MSDICRLCSQIKSADVLFNVQDPIHEIIDKVLRLCQINLLECDYLPQNVCTECLANINGCLEFIEKCVTAQDKLKQAFNIKVEENHYEISYEPNDEQQQIIETSLVVNDEEIIIEEVPNKVSKRKNKSPVKKVIESADSNKKEPDKLSTQEQWIVYETPAETIVIATEDQFISTEVQEIERDDDSFDNSPSPQSATDETYSFIAECDKTTDETEIKEERIMDSWKNYPWSCIECQIQVTTVHALQDHFTAEHQQTIKYHCIDCNKICIKYTTFLNHVCRRHRPHLKLCCDICWKFFADAKLYRKHRTVHGEDDRESIVCTVCHKTFLSRAMLRSHKLTHLPADERATYKCDVCDKSFDLRANLLIHKRIHTGIKDFTCDQCGKSFIQKGNLESHLLTHVPVLPFTCSICNKSFKTQVRLNNHASVHSGLKPHKCDICGRQFRGRTTLREHLRIHTGAMPFACEYCGKRFRFKGILATHRRLHTGERPYSCLDCNHHFTNWPNFNKHMKRRHGINTSVSVRKPQTIPPSGMPPQSKLNYVVPTIHNNIKVCRATDEEVEEEIANGETAQNVPTHVVYTLQTDVNEVDEAISDMQEIIEHQQQQVGPQTGAQTIQSYLPAGEPPVLSFYNIQNVDLVIAHENSSTSF